MCVCVCVVFFAYYTLTVIDVVGVQHVQKLKPITELFKRKVVILLGGLLIYKYVLGAQKNHLIETVLLSTHSICFG